MNGERLDDLRARLTGLSELLGGGQVPGSSAPGRARSPPRSAAAAAAAVHRSPPRFQSTVRPGGILRASNASLRDAPLGGLLQKYKDAEAAWLKEKGRLALAVKSEAARRQKAEGELRRSQEQLAFRVGEVKHLKEALKGRDGTIQDLQDRLRAFELAEGEERTASDAVRQAEAERDELRGAMGELLQRLSAANQVVGQAEAAVERLEGQAAGAAQAADAAQADASAARAEAAALREEVAELQWKCSLLQQLSDLTLKQNDEKTSTLRQLLESESLLDGEAGSSGEDVGGAAAVGGACGIDGSGLFST